MCVVSLITLAASTAAGYAGAGAGAAAVTDLVITGAAASVAGSGMAAYGSYKQGQFQKDMAKYNASLNKRRAWYAQKNGEIDAAAAEKRHRQLMGAGRAAFAGNGVLLESRPESATAMWEVDQAKEMAWEKERIRSNAELEAWGFTSNASALVAEGKNAAWAGNMGAVGSILSGAGTAAFMGAQASSLRAPATVSATA